MIDVFFNDNSEFKYDLAFYICKYCSNLESHFFDNFEKFWDYALKYHDYNIRFAKFKHRLQNEKYIRHARENVYNYSLKSSYNYVIVQISIFDWNFNLCLNIDDEVSFCNKVLFSRKYEVVHRTQSIIVIEIAKQQIYDKFIEQNVLIEFNKIFLRVKIYLIQNFQLSLIIDMNVFKRNDITF